MLIHIVVGIPRFLFAKDVIEAAKLFNMQS